MNRRAAIGLNFSNGGEGGGQASYVRLSTVTANVRRSGARPGMMTVETGVDVPDAALRGRATQSAPRLRAAYNEVVAAFAAALLPGAPPDVDRLARDLQAATDRVMGRAGARLLLGTVMVV